MLHVECTQPDLVLGPNKEQFADSVGLILRFGLIRLSPFRDTKICPSGCVIQKPKIFPPLDLILESRFVLPAHLILRLTFIPPGRVAWQMHISTSLIVTLFSEE